MTASLGRGQWPLFHLKYFLWFPGACPDSNQYNQAVATKLIARRLIFQQLSFVKRLHNIKRDLCIVFSVKVKCKNQEVCLRRRCGGHLEAVCADRPVDGREPLFKKKLRN